MDDTSSTAVAAPTASSPSSTPPSSTTTDAPASAAAPQPTTDRPSFKDALTVFNEAAKQQGKRQRGVPPTLSATDPSAPGTATTQPDGSIAPTTTDTPAAAGPIPLAVHLKALENRDQKTRQAVEQEYAARYGSPDLVQRAVSWFQNAAQDRVGFLTGVINEALKDPTLAPQIASLAGRTLSGGSARPAPTATPSSEAPAPDFQDGHGNQFYSAKQQQARDEWLINRVKSEVLGDMQPQLQTVESLKAEQQEREQEKVYARVRQTMTAHLTEARTWPYFKEHEADIKAALAKEPLTSGHPDAEGFLLSRVYQRIVGPKLSQLEQARVLADLKSRANASSLNPSATGAPSGVPKNVRAKDGGTFGNALKWAAASTAGRS